MDPALLCKVDAVTIPVPDLDSGLDFYVSRLGHPLQWRNDEIGQAAVALRDSDTEIVLTTGHRYEPNWLVDDVNEAVATFEAAGGRLLSPAVDIPVGRIALVADPFGNVLLLIDLSRGRYRTASDGTVTGIIDERP
jgi:predicted enzyme related to lactoylglutathione lyase